MNKPTAHPHTGEDGRAYHTFGEHGMCVRHGATPNRDGHCDACIAELVDLADPIEADGAEFVSELNRAFIRHD